MVSVIAAILIAFALGLVLGFDISKWWYAEGQRQWREMGKGK